MQYEISTIQQICDLTSAQQKDFLSDLAAWLEVNNLTKAMRDAGIPVTSMTDKIIWNDDGRPGEISEINIKIT